MLLNRFMCCLFVLSTISTIDANSYSSIKHYRDALIARLLLKSWRKKVEEQRVRFFDRLPQSVESKYTPTQVISYRGYPSEIHHVTTDDGYIIELHRIPPRGTAKKVVFLQHGVMQSSGTWLVNPSSRSLAILLADQSYDVWLGNFRGNRYSRKHTTLDPNSEQYWKFSWDQIGNYDIPAVINYILKETSQPKLTYIGHSLGCGVFFIAMVLHPELNAKIDLMVALAPLSSFAHFDAIFRILTPFSNPIESFLEFTRARVILDSDVRGKYLFDLACEQTYSQARFCRDVFILICGPNRDNIDPALIPVINENFMTGTSVAVIAQFAQNYNAGDVFQAYDYGREGNLQKYGSTKPYQYDLTKVTAPVYVFSGNADRIVTPKDVDWLLTKLSNLKGSTRFYEYNHLDFIWGTDVKERLYDNILTLLS
ncbi:hypothetical protein DAPPUDRAFT_332432 [Daphnia pulex]|uniref:Lipase n=1 Tax=Daphnia pulex TaxID=6669 RepID=E9HPY8_DAPPU|nr:hypothetical protein DAPPUDRAFT_332432 [Daphnia pulex]|eukprot:EFX66198.1 hypothetical protein DAPPUDRAFT_332432 [Daphnia pulex]